jgi:hypothetical protein
MPLEVKEVAHALQKSLAGDLQALLWHGSWAHGEATAASDHDLIVVYMLGYATKWALLAMKSRELLAGRTYPIARAELRSRLADPQEIELVDIMDRWPAAVLEVRRDLVPLAIKLDACARPLVAMLPEPPTTAPEREAQ